MCLHDSGGLRGSLPAATSNEPLFTRSSEARSEKTTRAAFACMAYTDSPGRGCATRRE